MKKFMIYSATLIISQMNGVVDASEINQKDLITTCKTLANLAIVASGENKNLDFIVLKNAFEIANKRVIDKSQTQLFSSYFEEESEANSDELTPIVVSIDNIPTKYIPPPVKGGSGGFIHHELINWEKMKAQGFSFEGETLIFPNATKEQSQQLINKLKDGQFLKSFIQEKQPTIQIDEVEKWKKLEKSKKSKFINPLELDSDRKLKDISTQRDFMDR